MIYKGMCRILFSANCLAVLLDSAKMTLCVISLTIIIATFGASLVIIMISNNYYQILIASY